MRMLVNMTQYDWDTWLMGIMRSFIGGAAGALTGLLGPLATDSGHFNITSVDGFHHVWLSMLIGFGIGGIFNMCLFLSTHSGPDIVKVVATETTVTKVSPQETQVSSVEKTTMEHKENKPSDQNPT